VLLGFGLIQRLGDGIPSPNKGLGLREFRMTSTLVIVQCYRDDGDEWLKDITGCFSLQLLALALWVARRNWRIYGSKLSIGNIAIKMTQAPV
jgi:hypothetical protein